MPPIARSASLPTVVSLAKLLHLIPAAIYNNHAKRDTMWPVSAPTFKHNDGEEKTDSPKLLILGILSMGLVLLGGVFAGLTLALMGSDDLNLRVLAASSDDPKERRDAGKVLRLLRRGRHWVLVVLLLANVIVNESLPLLLHTVFGSGLSAVVVSTIMIVIFGEVIPQAVCVRFGLAIGGACAPLVHFMMIIFAPVAWPLAKLLDLLLGHDSGHTYKKAELKSFLQFHREGEEPLRDDEITILNGVLSLNDRHVKEIMTSLDDCLVLPADKTLDHETVDRILLSGFSRIPIHEPGQPDNFIGMLLVKRLITYNPEDEQPVNKFTLNSLPEAAPDLNCFQALDYFQTGRAHLLLISETPGRRGGALGIISLEDLIEEIIGEEIIDETDRYQDNRSKRKAQRRATQEIMRGIIERQRVINAFSRRPSGHGTSTQSRSNSPMGGPREGLLVQLADEPETMGSPLKRELTLESENITVIATAPNGEEAKIVEAPIPHEGHPDMIGDSEQSNDRKNSDDTDKTATATATTETSKPAATTATTETSKPAAEAATTATSTSATNDGSAAPTGDSVPDTPTSSTGLSQSDSNTKKANGGNKKRKGKVTGANNDQDPHLQSVHSLSEPFPSFKSFKDACETFIAKYENEAVALGPGRTNTGWEWRSVHDKWRGESGYMVRRRVYPSTVVEVEEDDEASAPFIPAPNTLELSVVYSPSYRVPMLCLSGWDGQGVPLPLVEIEHLRIPLTNENGIDLPGGTFPLLQHTEHPVTGESVWSVHPCQVREAVSEVVTAEGGGVSGVMWLETWFMLSDSVVDLTR